MLKQTAAIGFLILSLPLIAQADTPWQEIAKRISEYAAAPSPSTATAALNVIPKTSVTFTNSPEENEANEVIYATGPMRVLEKHVLMKERASVALAFRMRHIADGAFLEDLDITLGKLIRVDPEMFLSELKRAHVSVRAMDGLVGNLGDEYVDQMERQCEEMALRRKALQSVAQSSLLQTREKALSALDEDMSFCQSAQQGAPTDAPKAARP